MTAPSNNSFLPHRWKIQHPIPRDVNLVLQDYSPLMRQLLYNRGIFNPSAAKAFLDGEVTFPTDPFLLKDMETAVARLNYAVNHHQLVAIYGDYDADGVTSTALMDEFLKGLGLTPRIYIPNRFDEGYGLNDEAIRQLAVEGVDLVITVDCGVRSIDEVTLAVALGMDVIVTDHHGPGASLPPAVAVINPKQPGDTYFDENLAGVGLAYKFAQAYLLRHPQGGVDADDWLDLVAIGTIADLAPLTGENRILVKKGLERIRSKSRPGLLALAKVAGLNLEACDRGMIGFGLGPRLNAAGRMDTAMLAFNLLTANDYQVAVETAQLLDSQNNLRQEETLRIRELASTLVLEQDPDAYLFFVADPDFNPGVVGLAASRLVDAYYRPAVIANQGEEFTVGSCRSIPEFHITEALDACADLLVRHGGHSAAAGFTVRNEHLSALVEKLTGLAEQQLAGVELSPVIEIDREIKLDKLTGEYTAWVFYDLHQLEPTGRGNPEPVFASYNLFVRQARAVGKDGTHLKLTLQAGNLLYDAIAFHQGHWLDEMPDWVDIAYQFEENHYMGRVTTQLNIKDIKPSESK